MPQHQFTLIVDGQLGDEARFALVEAGCDAATFSTIGDIAFGTFVREAPTLGQAVSSAIAEVESAGGLSVRRVEVDDSAGSEPDVDAAWLVALNAALDLRAARGWVDETLVRELPTFPGFGRRPGSASA